MCVHIEPLDTLVMHKRLDVGSARFRRHRLRAYRWLTRPGCAKHALSCKRSKLVAYVSSVESRAGHDARSGVDDGVWADKLVNKLFFKLSSERPSVSGKCATFPS